MASGSKMEFELVNGSSIAVIGGGPAGSFFTYYALDFASRLDLDIRIDVYEAKNFSKVGSGGCNHCGGIISESLVQKLSTDGVIIPSEIVQKTINSYTLHVEQGDAIIHTPSNEHRIASVFRGCGPKGCTDTSKRGFDHFLLGLCEKKGANVIREKVSALERMEDGIIVKSRNSENKKYDLVVGGVGLGKQALTMFKKICPEFIPPKVTKAYISEFFLKKDEVSSHIGESMHVFLLDLPQITFGALIPKENYVTLVLLGKDVDQDVVEKFISSDQVKGLFPKGIVLKDTAPCKCYPQINIKHALHPYDDRVVLIGDSASSKLYKNGIGAAYITGRAAAKTAIFKGVSKKSFKKFYAPVCRDLDVDNLVGKFIFLVTRVIQKSSFLKKGLLHLVMKEQASKNSKRLMSTALWDTFTGSAGYRNILRRFLNPVLLFNYLRSISSSTLTFRQSKHEMHQKAIGHLYKNGEVIIKQGTTGDCLFVIQEGKVEVIFEKEQGEVKIAELGKTEFFGEMGLFEKDVRSCTVRALGDAMVLTVDKKNFYKSIQEDASLAYRLLEKMSNRLREANMKAYSRNLDQDSEVFLEKEKELQ
ncbi:cyclic nucleotide-binding domain-containing protein [Lutimonas vermicola]|uniref:Cyclic nucleotide-binding domain-containing protein n=1 Tax=Lutimonas vermicola TaxID=414288 RepID=A0ABU9L451_9FLAO